MIVGWPDWANHTLGALLLVLFILSLVWASRIDDERYGGLRMFRKKSDLGGAARPIDFERKGTGTNTVVHGRESLGRAVEAKRLMGGELAALCATDPPYLVDYTGERPNDSGKDWTEDYREIDIKDADGFFRGLFTNVLAVIEPHAAIYCWHAHKRQRMIAEIWEQLGILDHQQIIWVKPSPVFGFVFWHFRHEPCMMGWRKGSKPEHDGNYDNNSVWEIDWEGKSRIGGNEHPTQKPIELFRRPMRKHTKPGAICFEPFSGSGSQIMAGEVEGRRVRAMELSPVFVDVAIRRFIKSTGEACGAGRRRRCVEAFPRSRRGAWRPGGRDEARACVTCASQNGEDPWVSSRGC